MSSILCIGLNPSIDISCTADSVAPTHKVRTTNQKYDPGGGAINVARVIHMLGGDPVLAYMSGGATGSMFETLLEKYGITQHRFEMSGSVRIAYMVREGSTDLEYRFVPKGPKVTSEEIDPVMDYVEQFEGDYIVASGSLPNGVSADCYARIADATHKKGARFVLDTSGEALQEALAHGGIFLAKPSKRELEQYVGCELNNNEACEAANLLVGKGVVENLVVSLGSQGAILANADGVVQLPSIKVEARSAVGAGDSFVAAMTWQLSQDKPVSEAFRFGLAAGAAAVMTSGTQLCRHEDVRLLFSLLHQPKK